VARIERFGQDPVFLEDEARRKLRLVRPGEVIYRLAEEPDLSDDEATERLQ
jgi:cell division protein FtsB